MLDSTKGESNYSSLIAQFLAIDNDLDVGVAVYTMKATTTTPKLLADIPPPLLGPYVN